MQTFKPSLGPAQLTRADGPLSRAIRETQRRRIVEAFVLDLAKCDARVSEWVKQNPVGVLPGCVHDVLHELQRVTGERESSEVQKVFDDNSTSRSMPSFGHVVVELEQNGLIAVRRHFPAKYLSITERGRLAALPADLDLSLDVATCAKCGETCHETDECDHPRTAQKEMPRSPLVPKRVGESPSASARSTSEWLAMGGRLSELELFGITRSVVGALKARGAQIESSSTLPVCVGGILRHLDRDDARDDGIEFAHLRAVFNAYGDAKSLLVPKRAHKGSAFDTVIRILHEHGLLRLPAALDGPGRVTITPCGRAVISFATHMSDPARGSYQRDPLPRRCTECDTIKQAAECPNPLCTNRSAL